MEVKDSTVIAEHTVLKGDFSLKGDLILAGHLTGNITSSGSVIVSSSGRLRGNVQCKKLENSGVIEGDVKCRQCITLKNGSRLKGNTSSFSFIMGEYAKHAGEMKMSWKP